MKARWFAPLVLSLLVACGGGTDPPPGSGGSAVLPDTTKILDATTLSTLSSISAEGRYSFAATDSTLLALEVGDVLIVGVSDLTPQGALRRVEAVAAQGAGMAIDTGPALVQDAFRDLHLGLETTLTPSIPGLQQSGITFPLDLSESGADGRVDLTGSLSVAPSFDLTLDLDIVAFGLRELSLGFGAEETLLATVSGRGRTSFDESVTLGTIPFAPILLTIPSPSGLVPLVLTPQVVIEAGLQGSIQGDFAASVRQQASFTAGLGYRDGAFGAFSDSDSDFEFDEPVYAAAASVKAWGGPRLEVLLYGAVGPFAAAEAYVELGAGIEGPPPCVRGVLNAGLTARAGVDFLADYETTLFNEAFELAGFDSCGSDPGAPRPAITWSRSFGRTGSIGERAGAVLQASDGTYLVVGASDLFGPVTGYTASLWAMRLDALGNIVWQRAFGGLAAGFARAVQEVPGGFVIASARGVMKIDTGGNPLWIRNYQGNGFLEIASLAALDDGSLVLAGRYGNTPQAWAMKLDPNGRVLWSRRYGGDGFNRVRATTDGGFILVGGSSSNNGDVYLVELDGNGDPHWQRLLDNRYDSSGGEADPTTVLSAGDWGLDVVEKPGGGYVVVGETYGSFPVPEPGQPGHYESWVVEVDAAGEITDSTVYRIPGDSEYSVAYAVAVRPNGSTVIVGRRADRASDLLASEDILILQGGAFSVLGGGGNDSVYAGVLGRGGGMPIGLTADGGSILAATSTSFGGREQFWLVKLSRTANIGFSYLSDVAGDSYPTVDATALTISPPVVSAPISGDVVATEVESTGVDSLQQYP